MFFPRRLSLRQFFAVGQVEGGNRNYRDIMDLAAAEDIDTDEFRQKIIHRLLDACPDKRRLIAIHIPKCAGTHLRARLAHRYPMVHKDLEDKSRVPRSLLNERLRAIAAAVAAGDTIFVNGHTSLSWYLARGLCRPGDGLLSVIRSPRDIVVSYVNHILTRFLRDRAFADPDTREWARLLGLSPQAFDASPEGLVRLGRRLLYEPSVHNRNPLCTYLGDGDFASAVRAITRSDIEITDVVRYDSWFEQKFGMTAGGKENVSRKIITLDSLVQRDFSAIDSLTDEDQRLYELLVAALQQTSLLSIFGSELASRTASATRRQIMPRRASTTDRAAGPGGGTGSIR